MNLIFQPGILLMRRLSLSLKLVVLGSVMVAADLLHMALGWMGALSGFSLVLYLLLAFYLSVTADVRRIMQFMDQTASGNLREKVETRGHDEFAKLSASMAHMVGNISSMVASIRSNSALVASAGQSLAVGNRDLSDRTEQQAANLEQTSASVAELSSTVQLNAQATQSATLQAGQLREVADHGAQTMGQAVRSVEAIQSNAKRMDEIVGVIDGLAFQTNILALNAAIEAARAGEAGRGFAVVASEVRSLAQRSADSAREIRQLISTSSSQVTTSVGQIRAAGQDLEQIVSGIRGVAGDMTQIANSSTEQSTGLSEVAAAVRQLDEITQRNAQMVERAVSHATLLEQRASTLAQAVASFRLQQGTADEAMVLVQRALQYRPQVSQDSFLHGITESTQGKFHERDMYVFVLDAQGRYLAFGGNSAKVGTRVHDVPGIDGQRLIDSIVAQADHEPGWVEYDITNPSTGRVQTKMSFVQKMDQLYVGCGVYKNLVSN